MNLIDLGVLIIILIFIIYGYSKGLIMTVFRFVSFFVSIALAGYLYPYVSRFLRGTPLYGILSSAVIKSMGLRDVLEEHTADLLGGGTGQLSELLNSLPVPDVLKDMLLAGNTPDIYELLRVETVEEYIGGFFANIVLNITAIILVFIISWVVLSVAGSILHLVGKLPVINMVNRAGGLAVGLIMGLAVSWTGLLILGVLFATPAYPEVYAHTQGSLAAKWFFDSGFVMELLTGM